MFEPKQASRKFSDLIHQSSSKFGNWDPSHLIDVGDYGKIDVKTGRFEKAGNIYDTANVDSEVAELAARYLPIKDTPIDELSVNSVHAKQVDFDAGADAAGFTDVFIKAQWQFGYRRAALLTMHEPVSISLPDEFFEASRHIPSLKAKDVVAQVYRCQGFVMYLSNKAEETVRIALRGNAPPSGSGGGLSFGWSCDGASGLLQKGYQSERFYTPLFRSKTIRKPGRFRRASPGPDDTDEDQWADTEVPWNYLDEDGVEESETEEEY